jgi:hypothetical protein
MEENKSHEYDAESIPKLKKIYIGDFWYIFCVIGVVFFFLVGQFFWLMIILEIVCIITALTALCYGESSRLDKLKIHYMTSSADDFYDRVVSTVSSLLENPKSAKKRADLSTKLDRLKIESMNYNRPLNEEQSTDLYNLALESLRIGSDQIPYDLSTIISYGGSYYTDLKVENSLSLDPYHAKAKYPHPFLVLIGLLADAGVFETDEEPLYFERGGISIKKKEGGRHGMLLLTNRRLFCVGKHTPHFHTEKPTFGSQLYYEDWNEKSYLNSLDYVYFNQFKNIELWNNIIKASLYGRFIEEKNRTFYTIWTPIKWSSHKLKKATIFDFFVWSEDFIKFVSFIRGDEYLKLLHGLDTKMELPEDYDDIRQSELLRKIEKLISS